MAQPRRRLTRDDLLAAEQEAKARMRAGSSAARLRDKLVATQARLPQPGDQGGAYQRAAVGEMPGRHMNDLYDERGDSPHRGDEYRTRIEGDTVHHLYDNGDDRSFHVDNADERRALGSRGVDYGEAQRNSGVDPSVFRSQIDALVAERGGHGIPPEGTQAAIASNPAMTRIQSLLQGGTTGSRDAVSPPPGSSQQAIHLLQQQAQTGGAAAPAAVATPVHRTAAQMRADNPAMVERVKRRRRGAMALA